MTTTSTRAQEIRAELEKLAPYPANGDVTARGLAHWMAMEAQLAWARMTGMDHPITMTDVAILQGNFAKVTVPDARVDVSRADLEAALTAKGPLPDGVYDRLRAAAGMAS